jgi:predicted metal-dependent enzyme (double-stranded beta helix superfamily)
MNYPKAELLAHTRHNTASGPDGTQSKHITGQDIKEFLRIIFNLVSKTQPRSWNDSDP